jgi:putative salt-induced outer membrane protein YdiY
MIRARPLPSGPIAFVFLVLASTIASAQPTAAPPGWAGSASAGLALTQGNSDTATVNVAYEVKRDKGSDIILRSTGLFIRASSESEVTADHTAIEGRVDRALSARTFLFGQVQFLRDTFKEIGYLVSPTVGVSRLLLQSDRTEAGVDAGIGLVWEKNPIVDVHTSGAVIAGQKLAHKLTNTAEFTERFSALWKMDDFGDSLFTFGAGLSASISAHTKLKAEVLDTYKSKSPFAAVKKNDVAVLLSFVFKVD